MLFKLPYKTAKTLKTETNLTKLILTSKLEDNLLLRYHQMTQQFQRVQMKHFHH